jgi:integrase
MARPPRPYWHSRNGCWASGVGEVSEKTGRRKPVYFRGIAKNQPGKAREALDAYIRARDALLISGADYTLDDLRTLYLSHSKAHAKPNTYHGHRKVLRLVRAFRHKGKAYAERLAREFTATDLDRIVQAWAAEGKRPTYIARMVASVQAVFNWASAPMPNREPERLIETNPLKGYSSPHCRIPDAPDRYADDAVLTKFLRWAWRRARGKGPLESRFDRMTTLLIRALTMTGARPEELCAAEWRDFEPRAVQDEAGEWWGTITLDSTRWKSGGRLKRDRIVYLPPRIVSAILAIKRLPGRHPKFIWTHRRGPRADVRGSGSATHGDRWNSNAFSRKVKTWRREAITDGIALADEGALRLTPYLLRHNAARKILAKSEGDTYLTGKLIGTSAAMVQKVYGSSEEARLVGAASGLRLGKKAKPES